MLCDVDNLARPLGKMFCSPRPSLMSCDRCSFGGPKLFRTNDAADKLPITVWCLDCADEAEPVERFPS